MPSRLGLFQPSAWAASSVYSFRREGEAAPQGVNSGLEHIGCAVATSTAGKAPPTPPMRPMRCGAHATARVMFAMELQE